MPFTFLIFTFIFSSTINLSAKSKLPLDELIHNKVLLNASLIVLTSILFDLIRSITTFVWSFLVAVIIAFSVIPNIFVKANMV